MSYNTAWNNQEDKNKVIKLARVVFVVWWWLIKFRDSIRSNIPNFYDSYIVIFCSASYSTQLPKLNPSNTIFSSFFTRFYDCFLATEVIEYVLPTIRDTSDFFRLSKQLLFSVCYCRKGEKLTVCGGAPILLT